jgi:hypothetical protein
MILPRKKRKRLRRRISGLLNKTKPWQRYGRRKEALQWREEPCGGNCGEAFATHSPGHESIFHSLSCPATALTKNVEGVQSWGLADANV